MLPIHSNSGATFIDPDVHSTYSRRPCWLMFCCVCAESCWGRLGGSDNQSLGAQVGQSCILNVTQNSAVGNSSFSEKKKTLFDEPMRQGLAAGLSAFGLADVERWDLEALKKRHAYLVRGLADRWGIGKEWDAMEATRGSGGNNDDDDGKRF